MNWRSQFDEIELIKMYFQRAKLPGEKVLIDVGAHVGWVSMAFLDLGWKVIAFEPEPDNLKDLIQRSESYSKQIQIVQKAVSDIPGQIVPFYVSSEHFGIHSLKPFHSSHQPKIEVETVRLDETLDKLNIQNVSFLKVDIEGADLLALKSFDFNRFRPPVVMCEFMDARTQLHFGYTHHDIVNFMSNFGYSTYVSEWSPVLEYGRKGETTSSFQELVRFLPWKPDLSPVWGNLIFVPHSEAKALELCYRRLVSKVKLLSSLRSVPFLRKAYQMTKRIIQKRN